MQGEVVIDRGVFGMPKPRGWTVERIAMIMAGALVVMTQIAQRAGSTRLRVFAGWVGANLMLQGLAGWCPASVVLHRLGVPAAAECGLGEAADRADRPS